MRTIFRDIRICRLTIYLIEIDLEKMFLYMNDIYHRIMDLALHIVIVLCNATFILLSSSSKVIEQDKSRPVLFFLKE